MKPAMRIQDRGRQNLHDALLNNRFSTYPPRTVQFKGEPVQVSEQQYQWLNLRGHLRNGYVIESDFLEVA